MKKTLPQLSFKHLITKKITLLVLFIVGVLSVFLYLYLIYFRINTIVIDTAKSTSLQGIYTYQNISTLLLNTKDVEQEIFKRNSYIKTIHVTKELPSTIKIVVELHTSFAVLQVSDGYFILSSDGRILEKTKEKPSNLPMINYYQKFNYYAYKAGENIKYKDIVASLVFLQKARNLGLSINSIDIQGFDMIALNTDEQVVLFTTEKSERDQIYQFEIVMRQLKIKGEKYKKIDLRFERVIIGN